MRIIATGDNHWSDRSRFAECSRVHQWIADLVKREKPDLFLDGGDLFDGIATGKDFAAASDWLKEIADVCDVVLVQGNHDRDENFRHLGKLRLEPLYRSRPGDEQWVPLETKHRLIVERSAHVHYVAGAAVPAIAWPKKGVLLSGRAENLSQEEAAAIAVEELEHLFRGLGAELAAFNGPRIAMGHLMILGSRVSTGQPVTPAADFTLGLSTIGLLQSHIVVCSHIHKPQHWTYNGIPIIYCGTAYATTYGETEEKSVLFAELNDQGVVKWERIPTPATKMVQLLAEVRDGNWSFAESEFVRSENGEIYTPVKGTDVRLRYLYDAPERDAARARAREMERLLRDSGAVDVKLDPIERPVLRARAPEITTATGLKEKLEVLWAVKGPMPDEAKKQRLFSKVEQLEAELGGVS